MKVVKKTCRVEAEVLRKAREISGARTDAEAMRFALRELVANQEIERAFERCGPVLAELNSPFVE